MGTGFHLYRMHRKLLDTPVILKQIQFLFLYVYHYKQLVFAFGGVFQFHKIGDKRAMTAAANKVITAEIIIRVSLFLTQKHKPPL